MAPSSKIISVREIAFTLPLPSSTGSLLGENAIVQTSYIHFAKSIVLLSWRMMWESPDHVANLKTL